jgi:hypothetical protein
MPEPRCDLTDLPVSGCSHCRPKPPAFEAMYLGTCGVKSCPAPIVPGDLIRDPGDGAYVHARHAL